MAKSHRPQRKFGSAVRRLRIAQDFSQEGFAEAVGVHRTFIGGIERGERNPTLTTIVRIAGALNITPHALLEEMERDDDE